MDQITSQIALHVTQTWRGKDSDDNVLPLHWALTFKSNGTDERPIGNRYHVAGSIDTYCFEAERDVALRNDNWRGSLVVGRVPEESIPKFERILSEVPIHRNDSSWNPQHWVWTSLRELRHSGFAIDPNLSWSRLSDIMFNLLEAWECGDI